MPEVPPEAVRAVAGILRDWEVDRSGEGDIAPVEEFDAEARELLEAATPSLIAHGVAVERARIAGQLHQLGDWPDGYSAFRAFVERHGLVYPGERPIFSALLLTLADLIGRGDDV